MSDFNLSEILEGEKPAAGATNEAPHNDTEETISKRKAGQIKADRKRQEELRQMVAEATAAAVREAMSGLQQQRQPEKQPVDFTQAAPESFRNEYGEVIKGFDPMLRSLRDDVLGETNRLADERVGALQSQMQRLQESFAVNAAGNKYEGDEDFEDFLDEETEVGVSRRTALESWKKGDPAKYATVYQNVVRKFEESKGRKAGFGDMAAPAKTIDAQGEPANVKKNQWSLPKVEQLITSETAKGPRSDPRKIGQLEKIRMLMIEGRTDELDRMVAQQKQRA
jgi:hypothetical protein